MFRDFGVTGLVATPSYALYLGEQLREAGYPREDYKLRLGLLGSRAARKRCATRSRSRLACASPTTTA